MQYIRAVETLSCRQSENPSDKFGGNEEVHSLNAVFSVSVKHADKMGNISLMEVQALWLQSRGRLQRVNFLHHKEVIQIYFNSHLRVMHTTKAQYNPHRYQLLREHFIQAAQMCIALCFNKAKIV